MRKSELIKALEAIPGDPEVMGLSKPTIYTGINKVHIIELPYNGKDAIILQHLGVSLSETILHEARPRELAS